MTNQKKLTDEKNTINTDQKVDTLRRIIEEQNERIGAMEEELAILRLHLRGDSDTESAGKEPDDELVLFDDDPYDKPDYDQKDVQ